MDPFSLKRIQKFVAEHRGKTGELATLKDLQAAGFSNADVSFAISKKKIEEFYVTLTNGTIVKGYKAVH